MKILHIITSLGVGGAENLLKELAILFEARGVNITIITLTHVNTFIFDVLKREGVTVITCPVNRKLSLKNVLFLKRHLLTNRYDIIHAHLTYDLYTLALANFLCGRKFRLVATEHSTANRRRRNIVVRLFFLENWLYWQYSKIICVSQEVLDSLVRFMPKLRGKCVIVNSGVNLAKFSVDYCPVERLKKPTILCVGSLRAVKDQATLIRAIKLIKGVELLLVGDGPMRGELSILINELNLNDRVFLLGHRPDIMNIMKKAFVYVQPSRYEGMSMAILEALASGLPIVSSDVPGMRSLIDGIGLLFPVGNVEYLAQIINGLLITNGEFLAELSEKSRKRASLFSIEESVNGYCKIYQQILL